MSGTLADMPSTVIQYLLIDKGAGTRPSLNLTWPIFNDFLPDTRGGEEISDNLPDNLVTVLDTAGKIQGRIQVTGEMVEKYGIQILLRCLSSETELRNAKVKINQIKQILDTQVLNTSVTIPGTARQYQVNAITRTSPILSLGSEKPGSSRSLFSINAICSITQLA